MAKKNSPTDFVDKFLEREKLEFLGIMQDFVPSQNDTSFALQKSGNYFDRKSILVINNKKKILKFS